MIRYAAPAVVAACLCLLSSPALSQGPDELWEITAKMTMEGMTMPSMPQKVCKKKGDNVPPADKNCKIFDVKTAGSRTTWRVECAGDEPMSGTGEMTMGSGAYQGAMTLKAKDGMTMVTEYSGKLVGNCTAK